MKLISFFQLLLLTCILTLTGCATTDTANAIVSKNATPTLKMNGSLDANTGLLVMSAGRIQERQLQMQRPFVSYNIFKLDGENSTKVAFLPAEPSWTNQFEKGKYGFAHIRELSAGKYALQAVIGRGSSLYLPAGGGLVNIGNDKANTAIQYHFEVKPQVVNYLGEFLITEHKLTKDSIKISNRAERDINALTKKFSQIKSLTLINTTLE